MIMLNILVNLRSAGLWCHFGINECEINKLYTCIYQRLFYVEPLLFTVYYYLCTVPVRPPEQWQHRQCIGLAFRRSHIHGSLSAASLVICSSHSSAIRGAQGVLPCVGWGGATSQLDLQSLMPLSVAGCGRLQLGAPHWATSVNYCKWLIIEPTFCGSRFSTGRLLAIEDFTFFLDYDESSLA